jgi:hypothetical protein
MESNNQHALKRFSQNLKKIKFLAAESELEVFVIWFVEKRISSNVALCRMQSFHVFSHENFTQQ